MISYIILYYNIIMRLLGSWYILTELYTNGGTIAVHGFLVSDVRGTVSVPATLPQRTKSFMGTDQAVPKYSISSICCNLSEKLDCFCNLQVWWVFLGSLFVVTFVLSWFAWRKQRQNTAERKKTFFAYLSDHTVYTLTLLISNGNVRDCMTH